MEMRRSSTPLEWGWVWIGFLGLMVLAAGCQPAGPEVPQGDAGNPLRIVSLAPSITETLYALGAGTQVVGVTRYCAYPVVAQDLPQVGDLFSPSVEAISRLHPDLVIMLPASSHVKEQLEKLGMPCLTVKQEAVDDILQSFETIGTALGREAQAEGLVRRIRAEMEEYNKNDEVAPAVLLSVGHEAGQVFSSVYAAGKDAFYDRFITIAGGSNVYRGVMKYPQLAAEGVLRMNPEVIIDLQPNAAGNEALVEAAQKGWRLFAPGVRAVQEGRVYILTNDYASIPGPRMELIMQDLKGIIHP